MLGGDVMEILIFRCLDLWITNQFAVTMSPFSDYRVSFLGVKWLEYEGLLPVTEVQNAILYAQIELCIHSPLLSVEFQNAWSFMPTPLYISWHMLWHRDKFIYGFYILFHRLASPCMPCGNKMSRPAPLWVPWSQTALQYPEGNHLWPRLHHKFREALQIVILRWRILFNVFLQTRNMIAC